MKLQADKSLFIIKIPTQIFLLQVEAGDVILKVNGTDVHRYSTKEGKFARVVVSLTTSV